MADRSELVRAVIASAGRLGVSPSDILTAMSYETGGRLDPDMMGGAGNRYRGLIQFGPEEQAKYGVKPGMGAADQVLAAENFLRDRGVKPGMGLLDIYSTINAGRPGLYNRSDAANGGMPGTVADKVATMAGHRARANALLGLPAGEGAAVAAPTPVAAPGSVTAPPAGPAAVAPSVPVDAAPPGGAPDAGIDTALLQMMQAVPQHEPLQPVQPVPINYVTPPGLTRARALARAMSNYKLG